MPITLCIIAWNSINAMIIKLWGVSLLKICCSFASKLSHFEVFEETALGRWGFDCEVWGDQSSIRGHLLALWWALCFKSHLHHRHLHWHQHYVWKGFRPDCCSLSKWAIGNYSKLLPPAAVPLVIITDQVCQGGATYVCCRVFFYILPGTGHGDEMVGRMGADSWSTLVVSEWKLACRRSSPLQWQS